MEVFDLIYAQFIFTTNSLGRQLTTSQFFQLLTPLTLLLVTAAIHCMLSEYATWKKIAVIFSQDKYQDEFYPPTVKNCITAEAITPLNYTLWGCNIPPPQWCSSAIMGAFQSLSALHSLHWCFDITFCTPYCLFGLHSSSRMGTPQSPSALLSLDWGFDISFSASYGRFCPHSFSRMRADEFSSMLLSPRWRSSVSICTPKPGLALLYFIQRHILPFLSTVLL